MSATDTQNVENVGIDQLLFFALARIHPSKTESEILDMIEEARELLEDLY